MSRIPEDGTLPWKELYRRSTLKTPKSAAKRGYEKWFMHNEKNGKLFDYRLIARSFTAYQSMHINDRDHFFLITGKEGSGKSTLATQIAAWIDPNFSTVKYCFTPKDYIENLRNSKRGDCLVVDEGGVLLFSRAAMTADSRSLIQLFMLQRQKGVCVILCCPSYWDIDPHVRNHRIDTMIRVTEQGKFMGYLPKAIGIVNSLQRSKKKLSSIKLPTGSFWYGDFRKPLPKTINREDYIDRKTTHFDSFLDGLIEDMDTAKMVPASKVAKDLSLTANGINKRIQKGIIQAKKIGGRWFVTVEERERLLKAGN